jgi:apolipoprotein N-acyltransferase
VTCRYGQRGITQVATWVADLSGVRRALLAAGLGALSVIAFAPLHVWPVLFVTFGALVWLLDGCYQASAPLSAKLKCAGLTGFWFGFGYFLAGLYWIAEAFLVEPWRHAWLLPFVMSVLPAGMALFFAAACAFAMLLWRPGVGRVFALAIAFFLAEFARGYVLTGFPWNLVGYGLTGNLPLMQLASLFGVYSLSLLAALLFASSAAIWTPRQPAAHKATIALAVFLLLMLGAGYFWGDRRLAAAETGDTGVRIRIVQANIDQAEKWKPENSAEIFNDYLDLTAARLNDIDLVIWPETAVPFLLADSPDALLAIADVLPDGTALLVGSARVVDERDGGGNLITQRIFNSLIVIDDAGKVRGAYEKMHLVPFGEYLPFQDFLESLGFMQLTGVRGGFSAGAGPRLLEIPGAPPASPLICYEIIFPGDVTEKASRPGWLLNVTNDAWFGSSAGPYQHFHQAQVRGVEQGLPVVRAANTGISAVIDPYGRIVAEIGLGQRGVLDAALPKVASPTLFVRFGNCLEMGLLALAALCWLACCVQPLRRHRTSNRCGGSALDADMSQPYEHRANPLTPLFQQHGASERTHGRQKA